MKIAIVLLGPVSEDTGGRNYLINFVKAISLLNRESPLGHRFLLYLSPNQRHLVDAFLDDSFTVIEVPLSHRNAVLKIFGEQVMMPFFLANANPDVIYFPGNFITLLAPQRSVVAIRSMLYYHYPEAIDKARLYFRRFLTPPSARQSRCIITPSHDIARDVMRFLSIPERKIRVIPHGVDTALFQHDYYDEEREAVFKKFSISKPFISYASALWRYKHQDALIHAFDRIKKDRGLDFQLLIVGKGIGTASGYERELQDLVKQKGLTGDVIFTGQLPHRELKYLYKYARLFAYPSGYESFGNPLFEAWAAGVPVVCANGHSFPEMTEHGRCAKMVTPTDIDALADALYDVATNDSLRASLIENGTRRVSEFSWKKCVHETLSVLEESA